MDNKGFSLDCTELQVNGNGFGTKSEVSGPPGETTQDYVDRAPLLCSSRLALSIISCLGFMNLYALRVNLSVAMVCMVNQTAVKEMLDQQDNNFNLSINDSTFRMPVEDARPDVCGGLILQEMNDSNSDNSTSAGEQSGQFAWPKSIQGLVLGSFFWGYLTTQVIGGILAERFGGKHIYGWFMFACAVVTLFMPLAANVDYRFLLVLRFIAGVCQGVVWPAMSVLWSRWAPPLERGTLCGICYAGAQIGNVLTFPIAALLCEYGFAGGWPSVFYVLGGCGIVWFVAWMYFVYDSPDCHPRVTEEEKAYIEDSLRGKISMSMEDKVKTPWIPLLTSMPVWAIVVTHTCANWGTYTFLTNIPTYMREVLYFDVKKNGLLSALPYIGFFFVINISGVCFDFVMTKDVITRTVARKIGNTLGLLTPGLFVIGVGYMDCTKPVWAVTLLVIGVSMSGFQYGAGFLTNPTDIAPRFSGIIFGISNTFATVPGFVAPVAIGYITTNQTQQEWQTVFFVSAGIYAFGALFYIIFGSGIIQEWAKDAASLETVEDKPIIKDPLPTEKMESRL